MRAFVLFALAAAVAVLAAGCGGSDSGGGDRPAPANPLTEEQLQRRLLTVADLPPGYRRSAESSDTTQVRSDNRRCERVLNADDDRAFADVEASFDRGELGPFLLESLSSFRRGEATRDFARVRRALDGCGTVRFDDPEIRGTMTLTRRPFPDLADETLAYALEGRLSTHGFTLPVHGDIAAVRIGDNEVAVLAFAVGPGGGPDVEALTRKAVEEFRAAGPATA
jgi:hypothetical protein